VNIIDIIIVLIILSGAVFGFKNGLTKQLVSFVGFIIVMILSFMLKNPVAMILYDVLPFFNTFSLVKGATILNILMYELLAFIIVFSILMIIYHILVRFTSIFETILKFTIVLGIPSKILGAIVGMIQYVFVACIVVYILSIPMFNIKEFNESRLKNELLNRTPFLSTHIGNTMVMINEFASLKEKYTDSNSNNSDFDRETLDLLLKYKVVNVKAIDKLVNTNKIQIDKVDTVLSKYR